MSWTVVGPIVTAGGENVRTYFSPAPEDFWSPIKAKGWKIPAANVRTVQQAPIPLRFAHGEPAAGQLVHLERRSVDGALWAVGDFDVDFAPLPGRDYFLSVEARWREHDGGDVIIDGAALCGASCMIGLGKVAFLKDGLTPQGEAVWRLPMFKQELIERAARSRLELRSRAGGVIVVHNQPDPHALEYRGSSDPIEMALAAEHGQWRPTGPLRRSVPFAGVIAVR